MDRDQDQRALLAADAVIGDDGQFHICRGRHADGLVFVQTQRGAQIMQVVTNGVVNARIPFLCVAGTLSQC